MNVAVIGASDKPERYSYQAVKLLKDKGHKVYPVHQRIKLIDGISVFPSINDIKDHIHTITLYVASDISDQLALDILNKQPERIIFNPGAENSSLASSAQDAGIETLDACTLVMLRTGQF